MTWFASKSKVTYVCNTLESIGEFYSIGEFERFQDYISRLLSEESLIEIPIHKKYAGFTEQWYKCVACQKVWRLVHLIFRLREYRTWLNKPGKIALDFINIHKQ